MNSDGFRDILAKLSKDKKMSAIIILGVVGILLIALSGSGTQEKESENFYKEDYALTSESELTEKLEKLIESIDGAGKARVMLTFSNYYEAVYAENSDESIGVDGEKDISREYIIIDSQQGETGLRLKTVSPEIRGVAVVCQGGSNPIIKEQIISVVSALFDISSNKISVAVMA